MNFADLSSIGAGAGAAAEAGDRTADVMALGVPADESVENDADRGEGEFGALLDLLALATQAAPPPAASWPQAAGPAPGTLESLTVQERRAVDATEIFRQVTALAATTPPEPGPEDSPAFPTLNEGGPDQEPLPIEVTSPAASERTAPTQDGEQTARIVDGARTARTVDAAREARALVEQAMAAARKSAAGDQVPAADSTPVAPSPVVATIASDAAAAKEVAAAARPKVDLEVAQPVETADAPAEPLTGDMSDRPAVPKPVTAAVAYVVPETTAVAEPPPAVAPNPVGAAPVAATSSSLLGDHASQGDRPSSDAEHTPSDHSGGARPPEATVIEPFSPQLAAKVYESAAAAASSPEVGELADVVPQIVRSIHLQSAGDVGHARVQLRPEHLGEVLVELRVEQGEVIASLEADVPAVREWIEARANELKEALGAQGLELLHFSVREREGGRREEPREHEQPRKQKRHAAGQDAVRFELPAA